MAKFLQFLGLVVAVIAAFALLWPVGGATALIGTGLICVVLALYLGSVLVP